MAADDPERTRAPMPPVAVLLPEAPGLLEWIFLGLLASLVGLVGLFSIYVIAQQFRNPGRGDRERDR